jgi:ribosome-associated toxin RatA of RatAB toxin-antitoxin module
MRNVVLTARIPARNARVALARIAEIERYPDLAADVREVTRRGDSTDWVVDFRRGPLRWTETEQLDDRELCVHFAQTEGDFAEFAGSWRVLPGIGCCVVRFECGYDFGVESLAGIMDPIAERVIKRVVRDVLAALFGTVTVLEGGEALTDHTTGVGPGAA